MAQFLILIFIVTLSVGCTIKEPPIKEYRVDVDLKKQNLQENTYCTDKILRVLPLQSNNLFRTTTMSYAKGNYELGKFTQSQWSLPPSQALRYEIISMLDESQLFAVIQKAPSRAKSSWVLEGEIEDFMQYFDADTKHSYVRIKIDLTIIDTQSGTIIASKHFSKKLPSQYNNAFGGVEALNKALQSQLLEMQQWFVKVCR